MAKFPLSNSLTRNVIEIILKYFTHNANYTLNFLCVALRALAEPQKLDHSLWKYDFTYFEVYLVILQYVYFINTSFDSDILEDDYDELDDFILFLFSHGSIKLGQNYE